MPSLCYLCLGGPGEVKVPGYGFHVCRRCWQQAEHGWDPVFEAGIFKALSSAGLLIPDRNQDGRLPREYQPPADYNL
jgi:hypothetical protein